MPDKLELTFLGYHWEWSGDLFHMTDGRGNQARVYVDSIGETWVDIRRIPEGGFFHSERVEAWRAHSGSAAAEERLTEMGFAQKRISPFAHRVRERD